MVENADPSTAILQRSAYSAMRNSSGRGLPIPDKTVPGTIDFSDCELWNGVFEIAEGTGNATFSGTNSSHRPALAVALPVVQWSTRLQVVTALLSCGPCLELLCFCRFVL